MRKRKGILFFLLLILTAVLYGCQGETENRETAGQMTKSEWIGLLGDKFGYNDYESTEDFYTDVLSGSDYYEEIQACAEWEVLTESGTFHPEEGATWRYAVETSVRAIGMEKLNKSDAGTEVTEDNLVDFFVGNIANVDAETLNEPLSKTDAELILAHVYEYASNLTLAEHVEYTYQDGVKEVPSSAVILKGDGITARVDENSSCEAGDVIYVEPSEESAAYAIRVTSVNGNEITYETASMEDIYEELRVTGTFEAAVIDVEPAEGVDVSFTGPAENSSFAFASCTTGGSGPMRTLESRVFSPMNGGMVPSGIKVQGNSVQYTVDLEEGASINLNISDIKVTSDVDFGILSGLKKADITVSFQNTVTASYKKDHMSKQVPLGTVNLQLGNTSLTVRLSLVANLGFDGEVVLTYSSNVVANANYKKGNGLGKSVSNNNASCDFHADATVTVEPCIKAELCCLKRGLANVKVISGVVAIATEDSDLMSDEPACKDVFMYVPLRWAVNEDGCVMTSINHKLKASAVVWDSENSPINAHFHWEDGQPVDACTRGQKVETEKVGEDGQPYDEYEIFDFEEIVFGFIKAASQNLYLSEGETMAVGILSVPDGYSAGALIYRPENTSVCTASGGMVTAVGSGSTTLRISTPDDKYSLTVTVIVESEYNDTSDFQPL